MLEENSSLHYKQYPKEHQATSKEALAIVYCDRLFELDRSLASNVLKLKRKTLSEFKQFLDSVGLVVNPKLLLLGKAIAYAQNQWKYLEAIQEEARLEVSNNRAKRAIRPFTIRLEEGTGCFILVRMEQKQEQGYIR